MFGRELVESCSLSDSIGVEKKSFFHWSLAIIYGGEIVKTVCSNLKIIHNCKISSFLGLEIRHSGEVEIILILNIVIIIIETTLSPFSISYLRNPTAKQAR